MKYKKEAQQGQILLITVMLLATALTVVLTTAFTGTTDTKITKLEADQQKALAAAEAGVEAALKQGVDQNIAGLGLGSGITGLAKVTSTGADQTFVTPTTIGEITGESTDEYTYYVADYNSADGSFANSWNHSLKIHYGLGDGIDCNSDVALDITVIYQSGAVKKLVAVDSPPDNYDIAAGSSGETFGDPSTTFACKTSNIDLALYPDAKVIIVRVLKQDTKLGFESTTSGTPLKAQGRLVTSEAKTQTGASRKVQLFQTYPQIPAELFVTSF